MRRLKEIVLFAFIATLFAACKKEEVPPSGVIGEPVFSFNGVIGSNNVSLQAGLNNYYMYSSFAQDSVAPDSVVYSFIGNLQSTSTNKNSFQISINDYKVSVKNASVANHIDSSFSLSSYFYYEPQSDTAYNVTFTPQIYSGSAEAFTYSFGDGTPNTMSTTIAPVTHLYKTETTYTTTLIVDFSSCGPVSLSNPINIGLGANSLIIDSITYKATGDTTLPANNRLVSLKAYIRGGTLPYSYTYDYGDGSPAYSNTSPSDTITVSHHYSSISTFLVNIKVTDKNGISSAYNVYVEDSSSSITYPECRFDYCISPPTPVTVNNNYNLSGITVLYTDGSGKIYTSHNPLQPNSSNFSITSVSGYKNNLNNEPTKELTVKFNCMLYNGSTSIPASGTATIAVAYQ